MNPYASTQADAAELLRDDHFKLSIPLPTSQL